MATQYSQMPTGLLTNWPDSQSGAARPFEIQRIHLLVRTVSSSQHLQPSSAPIVVPISNFDALNPWNKIRDEVATWTHLKADWDDEGAVAPSANGLRFLNLMINGFKNEGSPNAKPYVAGDGEFGLHWRLRGGRAILSILADGRVLAFCPRRSGDPIRVRTTLDKQIDMKAFYSALREIAQ